MSRIIPALKRGMNNENWNIGFLENCDITEIINKKEIPPVKWMKHWFKDRAFADPFILDVTDDDIIVLCEELVFGRKGRISRLSIARDSFKLLKVETLLELPTHLSYPAIIKQDGKCYIYPENSQAGSITLYEYDDKNRKFTPVSIIIREPLTDATILQPGKLGKGWHIISTKLYPDSQQNAFLCSSTDFKGPYKFVQESPIITDRSCSRPGGNFFTSGDEIYRPAQNCTGHYGRALKIMRIESLSPYKESEVFSIRPKSFRYNLGIHTLNFHESGIGVVDGYGYLHPFIGRLLSPLIHLRGKIHF